jgi:hypothetical protein
MKKKKDWLRFPTPDCPLCGGKGLGPPVKIWSSCGQPEFGGRSLRFDCYCVQKPGKRPTMDELIAHRDALLATAKRHS